MCWLRQRYIKKGGTACVPPWYVKWVCDGGLEVEVAFAFAYFAEVALDALFEFFLAEGLGEFIEEGEAFGLGFGASVVLEVFAEGEHGVGFAELLDEAGFGEVHEVGTHTAFAVAAGAEAGDVAAVDHHADDLVERAVVAEGELGAGFLVVALVHTAFTSVVAAGVGFGSGTDLAGTVFDQLVAHGGALAGGDDDAGVGHGDADDGHNLHEVFVVDGMGQVFGQGEGSAFGGLDAGEADGVGAAPIVFLKVAGMLHHGKDFEAVVGEAEEDTDAHIVDATFLSTVHAGEAVEVVAFWGAGGVEFGVFHGVVGFLEADIGADAFGFELGEVLHAHGSQFDVDAADGAAFLVLGGIAAADGLDHVVGIVAGALATDEEGAFVSHAQEVESFLLNLVHGENFAAQLLIVATEAAIDAVVDTGVARVDGGKEHKAFAVDFVLAVLGSVENLLDVGLVLDAEQFGYVLQVESFQFAGFVEDIVQFRLGGNIVLQQSVQLIAVDEILVSHKQKI